MVLLDRTPTEQDATQHVLEAIRNRRSFSLKQISPEPIDLSDVELMLEAANWAPNHGHTEPWRFTVFAGEGRKALSDAFGEACRLMTPPERYSPEAEQMQRNRVWQAPVWISIGMAPEMNPDGSPRMPEWEEIIAVGCAVNNAHMMASALGLGAKWTSGSVVRHEHVARLVGLEPPAKLLGFLYVGRPAAGWPSSGRRPIADKVVWRTEAG